MKHILLSLATMLLATMAMGQLGKPGVFFKNHTQEPVYVATAYYSMAPGSSSLHTNGWTMVHPRQTVKVLDARAISNLLKVSSNIFYYAISQSGVEYDGPNQFAVDPTDMFDIPNANMEYVMRANPEYALRGFRQHTLKTVLGMGKVHHIVDLRY